MTMLSFRVSEHEAAEIRRWAERLRVDRSTLLREALRSHLGRLASEDEIAAWTDAPRSEEERAFDDVADWGPAEDWSDWDDAAR